MRDHRQQKMTRLTPWVFFAFVCLSAASAEAQSTDTYSGQWKMTSMQVDVTIESWGENCGPRPRSYASNRSQSVAVYARGEHLIFSKGGVRTDRCWSPNNPRIKTISASAHAGQWKRICQTPKDDPKYERGEYALTATDADTLVYLAVSKFEWTLKGDHCTARLVEKRRYIREKEGESEPPSKPQPVQNLEIETDVDEILPDPGCTPSGPVKRLSMVPETVRLNPGERICFRVFGFDAADCRHKVDASFRVTQGGQAVPGLVQGAGCFVAGQTAAESEGVYEVTARAGNHAVSSRVEVVFPDLGELLAARLSPLDDMADETDETDERAPAHPEASEKNSGVFPPAKGLVPTASFSPPRTEEPPTALIVTVAVAALFLGGFALVFLVLRRRRNDSIGDDDLESLPDETQATKPASALPFADDRVPAQTLVCPTCKEEFSDQAKFCPHDRTPLVPAAEIAPPDRGMVCPLCNRGYEADARFCPHDSAALITYAQWRSRKK